MELHRAGEDYLKTILILQEKDGAVRSLDVAEMLRVSKPSVCRAIKHLREGGFLTMNKDKKVCLTDVGREAAEQVLEKHRVLKDCLISMGVDPEIAEKDACRMEHSISAATFEQMKHFVSREAENGKD